MTAGTDRVSVVRAEMDNVTFGDPFRVFQEDGGTIVLTHYDSPVTHPNHLWSGRLVRAGSDPSGEIEAIASFARDLPGAELASRPEQDAP